MIKINGMIWKIILVSPYHPELMHKKGPPAIGCCNDLTKTIYISNSLTKSLTKEVLLHEIVHAIMFSYNVEISDENEEIVAMIISTYGKEIMNLTNIAYKQLIKKLT